jgi:hypothetical protein
VDPLEWLARLSDHIPDPGRHRTHFYGFYANRVRGERPRKEVANHGDEEEEPKKRRCPPSWARLIGKVFEADPGPSRPQPPGETSPRGPGSRPGAGGRGGARDLRPLSLTSRSHTSILSP